MKCQCTENRTVSIIGLCDPDTITLGDPINTTQISIPELLTIPCQKPPIETIDKVFINVKIISKRVIKTPSALDDDENLIPNEEGTLLTGRKLIIEGIVSQKVVYTADVLEQSVHSANFDIPFSAFIMLPKDTDVDDNKFCVETCIEDVFVKQVNPKQLFKNVTLFLSAVPLPTCA